MSQPAPDSRRILIVEDDDAILTALRGDLEFEGFAVSAAQDGRDGFELAAARAFDLIILDVLLPRMNGFEICKRLRERGIAAPILMLTAAKTEESDKVTGFELGADDYVTKPFSMRELMARVKALMRRGAPAPVRESAVRFDDVEVNFRSREARKKGKPVHLTALEFDVLRILVERRGAVVTRDELLDAVWEEAIVAPKSIDPHIFHLRRKLESDPARPRHILGVRSVGYKFQA
jgi:DNA-binding response OmpR family regulator